MLGAFISRWKGEANPKKKLDFIKQAIDENRSVIGKMSCFTAYVKKGVIDHYEAEYMYMVDNKGYFVTYKMAATIPDATSKEDMNADMLLAKIPGFLILYYEKEKPSRVFCKKEIFTSVEAYSKIDTPRKNIYRDVDKMWSEAVRIGK